MGKFECAYAMRQSRDSKPYSAVATGTKQRRRQPREEAHELQALQKLQDSIRKLDVEAMLYWKGASHGVAWVYSPPRVVDMAHAMGFKGGYSLDPPPRERLGLQQGQ